MSGAQAQGVSHLEHDAADRLRSVEWPGQGGWQYNLDAAGNIRQIVRRGPALAGGQLNDTGIGAVQCYAAGSSALVDCSSAAARSLHAGQDGMTGRDADRADDADGAIGFSFLKLDAAGKALPASATQWACVKDQVTGLVWENKTADGGAHDGAQRYTGHRDGRAGSASGFAAQTNAAALCGFKDWRVPSRRELIQAIHMGQAQGTVQIDTRWHEHLAAEYHWSSDLLAGSTSVWVLDMRLGGATSFWAPEKSFAVRLVRGPQPQVVDRFKPIGDGSEVLDQWTGLAWQRCPVGMSWSAGDGNCLGSARGPNHEGALVVAEQVRQSTGVGWRLPSVKEMESLVDLGRTSPSIDTAMFPSTPKVYFWTSTPVAANPAYAWCLGFIYGSISPAARDRSGDFVVRLVRDASGQN